MAAHETGSLESLSRRIAALLGRPFGGVHALEALVARHRAADCYYVPDDTLDARQARALGITGPGDLFGGVVPHRFAATKLVSHPAVDADEVPEGWPRDLGDALADAVLPGFAVFSAQQARRACRSLLRGGGSVRVKLARGVGGQGQAVVADCDALDAILAQLPADELERHGATLE